MSDRKRLEYSALEPVKLVKFLGYTAAATLLVLAAVEIIYSILD